MEAKILFQAAKSESGSNAGTHSKVSASTHCNRISKASIGESG